MDAAPSLSTIVPVYNEVAGLEDAVGRIEAFVAEHFGHYEIILVESGSTDGSAALCDRLAAVHPCIRVIHEGAKNGFGSAQRLGFAEVTCDLVWVVSSDMPFPLAAILQALPPIASNDCVLSYRCDDDRGWFRRVQSWAYNSLARALLRLRASNINSQFKLYRRELIQSLELESNGWLIDTEIIYRLERAGARYAEIGVPLTDRLVGTSTVGPLTPLNSLRELMTFAWLNRGRA